MFVSGTNFTIADVFLYGNSRESTARQGTSRLGLEFGSARACPWYTTYTQTPTVSTACLHEDVLLGRSAVCLFADAGAMIERRTAVPEMLDCADGATGV